MIVQREHVGDFRDRAIGTSLGSGHITIHEVIGRSVKGRRLFVDDDGPVESGSSVVRRSHIGW